MIYPTALEWEYSNTFATAEHYDLKTPVGVTVFAIEDTQIVFAGISNFHSRDLIGNGKHGRWEYGHFSALYKTTGFVKEGELIGLTGGWPPLPGEQTTGPHLHIRLREGTLPNGESLDWVKILKESEVIMSDYQRWFEECERKALEVSQTTGVVRPGDGLGTIIANLEHCAFLTGKVKDLERENAELKKSGWTEVAPRIKKALGY